MPRHRVLHWTRNGTGDHVIHFDSKGLFEIRPSIQRGERVFPLRASEQVGGRGLTGRAVFTYKTLPQAKDAATYGTYPKVGDVPKPKRAYNRRAEVAEPEPEPVRPTRAKKTVKASKAKAARAKRATKQVDEVAQAIASAPAPESAKPKRALKAAGSSGKTSKRKRSAATTAPQQAELIPFPGNGKQTDAAESTVETPAAATA